MGHPVQAAVYNGMRTVKISSILQSTKSVLLRLTDGLGGKEAWRPLHFQKNSAMATLGLKEMGKFLWEGREKGLPCWLSQFCWYSILRVDAMLLSLKDLLLKMGPNNIGSPSLILKKILWSTLIFQQKSI